MSEDEKQKPGGKYTREDFNSHQSDAFRYGMDLGSGPEFMESLRRAMDAGIIGVRPPMTPYETYPPGGIPLSPQKNRAPKDAADEKIAELERRLQLEGMERRRLESKLGMAKEKLMRLERDNRDLSLEKLRSFDRPVVPEIFKKYLKFLIFACHPDRNPGRDEALEVTKALLDLRRK